ncbi:MAG: protein translocase subunit SecD, partial [Proteobacteria bacterium]|nr:protein translocase subunit SecD [Pseudomonadota bacterium]
MKNKYPLWKNLCLIALAVIGLIYALPNLYSEEPAVQISSQAEIDLDALKEEVNTTLAKANIPHQPITISGDHVEIRFNSTDTQLHARDVIKNSLDSQYTVALNLAPATPSWFSKIGAEPMKQGLDLRGGVHFLLEVDVDSVISRHYEGIMKNLSQKLREEGIRYSGIRYLAEKGVNVGFRDDATMDNSYAILKSEFPNYTITKSEATHSLLISLSATELNTLRQTTIEQTMSILRNRVNELGVGEAVVQQQGATRIGVDLPGIQDAARAKQILGGTATLQFYLVDQDNDAQVAKQTGVVPLNSKLYIMDGAPILL